jgi:hypothetical protein
MEKSPTTGPTLLTESNNCLINNIHTVRIAVMGFIDKWVAIVSLRIKIGFIAGLWGSWTVLVIFAEERTWKRSLATGLRCAYVGALASHGGFSAYHALHCTLHSGFDPIQETIALRGGRTIPCPLSYTPSCLPPHFQKQPSTFAATLKIERRAH